MPLIKNPVRAYRRAREAFRNFNTVRKHLAGDDHKERDVSAAKTEPVLRTSTKAAGGMTAGAAVVYVLAELFPEYFMRLSPETLLLMGAGFNVVIGWLIARMSRTPSQPGKL